MQLALILSLDMFYTNPGFKIIIMTIILTIYYRCLSGFSKTRYRKAVKTLYKCKMFLLLETKVAPQG